VEAIESQRNAMVAALYSNTNWDDPKNDRAGRLRELNDHFNKAIEHVYAPELEDDNEPDWNNPFWQGHQRSMQRTRIKWGLEDPNRTMQDVIKGDGDEIGKLRLLEARAESRRKVDQLNAG
jgi:hypothetical protein